MKNYSIENKLAADVYTPFWNQSKKRLFVGRASGFVSGCLF